MRLSERIILAETSILNNMGFFKVEAHSTHTEREREIRKELT